MTNRRRNILRFILGLALLIEGGLTLWAVINNHNPDHEYAILLSVAMLGTGSWFIYDAFPEEW